MEKTTAGASPVEIEFDAKAVAPLALFVAKCDIRYYLMGLCVMPAPTGEGCIVIGCDGHRLAMWHDPEGKCSRQSVLKLSPAMVAACKKRGKLAGKRTVSLQDGRLVLSCTIEGEVFVQAGKAEIACEGEWRYPDVWRVVPDNKKLVPGLRGYMKLDYLKDIAMAGNLASECKFFCVSHYSSDEAGDGAIVSMIDGMKNFIIITMPMRGSTDFPVKNPLPDVFKRKDDAGPAMATISHPMGSMGEDAS